MELLHCVQNSTFLETIIGVGVGSGRGYMCRRDAVFMLCLHGFSEQLIGHCVLQYAEAN